MLIKENIKLAITHNNYKEIGELLKKLEEINALDKDESRNLNELFEELRNKGSILNKSMLKEQMLKSFYEYYDKNKNSQDKEIATIISNFKLLKECGNVEKTIDACMNWIRYYINDCEKLVLQLKGIDILAGKITMYELITSMFPNVNFNDFFESID